MDGFNRHVLARALDYDASLSRREQTMEELQMNFTQLDTWL